MKRAIAKNARKITLPTAMAAAAKKPKRKLERPLTATSSAAINVIRTADVRNALTSVSCRMRIRVYVHVSQ